MLVYFDIKFIRRDKKQCRSSKIVWAAQMTLQQFYSIGSRFQLPQLCLQSLNSLFSNLLFFCFSLCSEDVSGLYMFKVHVANEDSPILIKAF